MSRPRFSIVIPARNRAHTLRYALHSCLAHQFDDYEIIVCDNCSSPATREVAQSFNCSKIKYIRSDVPLAMSDNWELAVSQANGQFITVLGDDDALLRHALTEASRLIEAFNVQAMRWNWVLYHWPDYPFAGSENRITFAPGGEARLVRSRDVM